VAVVSGFVDLYACSTILLLFREIEEEEKPLMEAAVPHCPRIEEELPDKM